MIEEEGNSALNKSKLTDLLIVKASESLDLRLCIWSVLCYS